MSGVCLGGVYGWKKKIKISEILFRNLHQKNPFHYISRQRHKNVTTKINVIHWDWVLQKYLRDAATQSALVLMNNMHSSTTPLKTSVYAKFVPVLNYICTQRASCCQQQPLPIMWDAEASRTNFNNWRLFKLLMPNFLFLFWPDCNRFGSSCVF